MKKIYTLMLTLLFLATGIQAQTTIFTEDFEAGDSSWTITGNDSISWLTADSATAPQSSYFTVPDHTIFAYTNDDETDHDAGNDFLVSPSIDLSTYTAAKIEFDIYYRGLAGYNGDPEIFTFEVSTDSGATWTAVDTLPGYTNAWQSILLDITSYAGQSNVMLGFRYNDRADWLYGAAVDDIHVYQPAAEDLAVINVFNPTSGCSLSNAEVVSAEIENLGAITLYSFDISYSINGGAPVIETVSDTLPAGSTIDYDFNTAADLSTPGIYEIIVKTKLANDADSTNDMASVYVLNNTPIDLSVDSFTLGFEPSDSILMGGLTVLDENADGSTWALMSDTSGTYTNSGIGLAAYSYNAANYADDWLVTSCFDLKAAKKYQLTFYARSRSATFPESLEVYYGSNPESGSLSNLLLTYNDLPDSMTLMDSEDFNVSGDGIYYFGIKATSAADMWQLYIDDLVIKEFEEPIDTSANINDYLASKVSLYPNPAKNQVRIELGDIEAQELSIINVTGQKLLTLYGVKNEANISLRSFESGFYMVQIITEKGIIERKLIVE